MILKKYGLSLTAALVMLLSTILSGCGTETVVVKEKPSVSVMELKKSNLSVTVDYPAKLVPSEQINISSKIPGRVSKVYFDVGDEVKKGDILFTLEAEDSKSQLRQSEAALSGTKDNIRQQLLEAETGVNQAQLQYDNVKSLYEKSKTLYEQGATSKQELDNMETSYENAKLNLETAQKNLDILKGKDSNGLASARTNQAQSAVDAASVQVENSVIRSPIDGKVSVCNVKAGELTSSGVLAYTVMNSENMEADINVPEEVQKNLSKGQILKLKVGVSKEQLIDGVIDTIGLSADSKTGFYIIKLQLENKNGVYRPGMFAKAVIPSESKEGIFTVPGGAVVSENGIEYLYLVSKGSVVKSIISTGISSNKAVEVTGDLKEGDQIILEGQSFLDEGEKVNVVQSKL
jgi:HlyD family secretion protein